MCTLWVKLEEIWLDSCIDNIVIKGCQEIPRRFSKKYLEVNSIIKQYNSMDWDHRVQYFLAVRKVWAALPFPRHDCQCRNCPWKDIGSQRGVENVGKLEKRKLWLPLLSTSWYSLAELRGTSDSANLPIFPRNRAAVGFKIQTPPRCLV